MKSQKWRANAQTGAPVPRPKSRDFQDIPSHGESRTRTGDTTIFSRVLYQLMELAVARKGSAMGRVDGVRSRWRVVALGVAAVVIAAVVVALLTRGNGDDQ